LTEVKNQVALLTLDVTEKLLRKKLSDDKSQVELVDQFIKDLKLN
jgi:F-type H+-transporting ATPase subunit b